uniref:Uncharacterized protein n=1 Tax=Sphaerodactylus townsendi TaxID=933632 RepID=A0ACB8EQY4_9SAUR
MPHPHATSIIPMDPSMFGWELARGLQWEGEISQNLFHEFTLKLIWRKPVQLFLLEISFFPSNLALNRAITKSTDMNHYSTLWCNRHNENDTKFPCKNVFGIQFFHHLRAVKISSRKQHQY